MSPADEYEIHITLSPDGTVSIGAYCLCTDYWNDYLAFLGEAKQAGEANHRNANRYLRAANMCLFAHLEGVVGHLQDCIKLSNKQKRMPLCERMSIIETEARKHGACSGLDLQLDKYVRDVITHPNIQKKYPPKTSEDQAGADSLTVDTGFVFSTSQTKRSSCCGESDKFLAGLRLFRLERETLYRY